MTTGTPHQALYRRWRAQTFTEIVGQEAVVATLRNAVLTGRVSHAILFTGPRGTGKTSLARILAKALNCTNLGATGDPCDACPSCVAIREGTTLDVLEIDAASNRGIESIRDLRERLNYPPGELRRKVYILDEAHQITPPAWNALLKSLEEPPEFVTFMFASTHPQEFLPAILSRLQRFDVRRLTVAEITGKLERILAADGREADPDAVGLVARLAAGGMRDAESILDQLLSGTGDRIGAAAVRDLLGLADAEIVDAFVAALSSGDAAAGIVLLDQLEERGRDLRIFLDQVVDTLREQLLAGLSSGAPADPALAAGARRLAGIDPTRLGAGGLRLQLELAVLEPLAIAAAPLATAPAATAAPAEARPARPAAARPAREPAADPGPAEAREPAAAPGPAPKKAAAPEPAAAPGAVPEIAPARDTAPQLDAGAQAPIATPPAPAVEAAPSDDLERIRAGWSSVLGTATPALKAVIKECRPIGVDGSVITLGFPEEKPFMRSHAERNQAKLESHFGAFLGHDVRIRCVVSNLDLLPPLPADADAADILAEAHRIFAEDLADVPEVT